MYLLWFLNAMLELHLSTKKNEGQVNTFSQLFKIPSYYIFGMKQSHKFHGYYNYIGKKGCHIYVIF